MSTAEGVIGGPGPVQPQSKVRAFLRLVMIEHSVFALPFAYIASLTAMFQLDRNIHWGRLLLVTSGPVDHLDHASYQQFWGGKAGLDATRKLPSEGYPRGWPEMITQDPAVAERVTKRWKEYGL